MPYVPIPKDLSRVKTKVVGPFTKRQAICFGTAALFGVPTYFLTRGIIGNSPAVLVMIVVMLPAFFIAMYEKDGQPAEKILRNIIRSQWFFPQTRPYKTENFYHSIEREGAQFDRQNQRPKQTGKTPSTKRQSGKAK